MEKNMIEQFRREIEEFREITDKFYKKEVSMKDYKSFSGGFGSYAQRGGENGMLRLRLCGGRVTKDYLKFIVESVKKYQIDLIHITTCQSIQLHNLSAATICSLVEEALDHGIVTRGGGGDYPRNVMVTPLTGVEQGEYFDMTPYADEAADYLLSLIGKIKLPRKLKVCFSSTPENWPHATFRDLGFVATKDGMFDVYCAGGLGSNPKFGVCVATAVDPEKILYYVKAMVDTFITYGNYEKRTMARTRYMQDTLGQQGLKDAYLAKLQEAMDKLDLDIKVTPKEIKKASSKVHFEDKRAIEQKQNGLYSVYYHPIGGNLNPEKLEAIYETIKSMEDVELRLTPTEGLYFINCTAEEAKQLIDLTDDGAKTLFDTSVACIGASICQVGLRDSQQLLSDCVRTVQKENFADGVLPSIHISGCPSSCAAHQTARLGFRGTGKKTEEGLQPAFLLFANGSDYQENERFGDEVGILLASDIPTFLVELGHAIQKDNSTFDEWINTHYEEFLSIANKYI